MATRRRQSESPPLEIRQFTPEEIRQSITKLKRRIAEVQDLQTDHVLYKDQRVRNTEENISTTILEIFGERSPQYKSYGRHSIRPMTVIFGDIPESESQREFLDGIPQTVKMLEGLITWLEEKQVDMGHDPSTRARAAFSDLDLHLRITDVCADLYRDGHYRNAVLDGAVALVNFVKERSRRHDL